MVFHLTPLQILVFSILGLLVFSIFMAYIFPRYFEKANGGKVKAGSRRPNPILMDKSIPGGQAMIEGRESLSNGKVILHLRNRNSSFIKEYTEEELQAVSIAQVMCDTEAPIFTTRDVKYARMDFDKDLRDMLVLKEDALRERDYWKNEFDALRASKDAQVDKEVERMKNAMKGNQPDWKNVQR